MTEGGIIPTAFAKLVIELKSERLEHDSETADLITMQIDRVEKLQQEIVAEIKKAFNPNHYEQERLLLRLLGTESEAGK